MKGYDQEDTICALATPAGIGAIGVVRLSGKNAIGICDEVFPSKNLSVQNANTLHVGQLEEKGQIIDEVVVSIFKAPKSYTGEDVVEISCHGSPYVQGEVIRLLLTKGARMAKEGEFTFRAFINGKLDLSQAEAVADLIASDSKASRDLAISQLRGGYAYRLKDLRDQLIHFASMLELELDFAEEDVDFADRKELEKLIGTLHVAVDQMIESFEFGNAIKQGVPVAIIGEPNVGKSTLLNQILKEDRAIVSDIPGTTRDVIEDVVNIDGVIFRFIDTAGLRESADIIEEIGILKARQKAEMARIVLYVIDASNTNKVLFEKAVANVPSNETAKTFFVLNKIDHMDPHMLEKLKVDLVSKEHLVYVSAKNNQGVDHLLRLIQQHVQSGKSEGQSVTVTNARHLESLKNCKKALVQTSNGLADKRSSEFLAMDVKQALHYLGEITGEVTTDDLLGNIFSRFCIGK